MNNKVVIKKKKKLKTQILLRLHMFSNKISEKVNGNIELKLFQNGLMVNTLEKIQSCDYFNALPVCFPHECRFFRCLVGQSSQ